MPLDGGEKSIFMEKNQIDDGDVDWKILEIDIAKIVLVFLRGDEGNCAGAMSCFDKLGGFGIGIAMMIGEGLLSGDGESPVLKVSDECAGIADAAERIEGARAKFGGGEKLRRQVAEFAKTEQARLRGENRDILQLADGRVGAGIGFGATKNQQIGASHGGERFAETASGKKAIVFGGARRIEEEDVDVAGELKMLEAIVEQKNIDAGLLEAQAVGVAIRTNAEFHAIRETRFHEFNFIAGAGAAFVTTSENSNPFALSEKTFGEPNDHGSLAGAAETEIADTDDGSLQALGAENPFFVKPSAELYDGGVQDG